MLSAKCLKPFRPAIYLAVVVFMGILPVSESSAAGTVRCLITNRKCDFDKDGLLNGLEKKYKTNPKKKDTDKNGILDGDEDLDADGISNEDEDDAKCKDRDTDHDGLADEDENDFGMKSKDSDTDNDGVLDGEEDNDGDDIANEDEDDNIKNCPVEDRDDNGVVPVPTPTRAPGTSPTPKPTTAPPTGGNTCSSRNTSGFGIPSGIVGNGQAGRSLWIANCMSCHGNSKSGSSYSSIYNARNRSDMLVVKTLLSSVQNAANLTADRNCP